MFEHLTRKHQTSWERKSCWQHALEYPLDAIGHVLRIL